MNDDDSLLTGFIDGELDGPRQSALIARLGAEAPLRERLALLQATARPVGAALARLLQEAPVERLKQRLAAATTAAPTRSNAVTPWRALAAGVALLIFVGGLGLGRLSQPRSGQPDAIEGWRDAVAEYAELYSAETFAGARSDPGAAAAQLGALSAKLGLELSPEKLRFDGLAFKAGFLLHYGSAPLGEIVLSDAQGAPVLFCILRGGQRDAPLTDAVHGAQHLTSWAHDGRGYLVIAPLPAAQVAEIAAKFSQEF